jgi:hypothetical protein
MELIVSQYSIRAWIFFESGAAYSWSYGSSSEMALDHVADAWSPLALCERRNPQARTLATNERLLLLLLFAFFAIRIAKNNLI